MTGPSAGRGAKPAQVFAYFAPLTLFVYLAAPNAYLIDIATAFMLKDRLHASANDVAMFRLLTGLPLYFAFVFGFARDLWNPFGLRDRGFFLIFATLTSLVFFWLAFNHLTYFGLVAGMLLAMLAYRFVAAAYQGLLALVGQEQLMSGRLSALWNIIASVPAIIGAFASGWVAENLTPERTFILCGALALLIAAFSLWKPHAIFGRAYDQPQAKGTNFIGDVKRLVRHRAIYAPVILIFMFQFAPGSNTPLQYYLTDHLHASDAVYGEFTAIFAAAFIPVFFLYGWLCQHVSLGKLLFWGTVITIPQMMPLALIHSATTALWLAFPIGSMGGIFAGAIFDLAMRSCPPGLQGTLMMLVEGANQLSYRGGDLIGSKIYGLSATNGFLYCALATTAVYALMLPVLLLIPKSVIATADGEANPALDAEIVAEVAEVA